MQRLVYLAQIDLDVHIAIHPTNPNVMYIAEAGFYWRSTDAFATTTNNKWIGGYQCDPLPYDDINWQLSYPNHHPDQHYMMFLPSDPNVMINVNDGGIYKTVDNLVDSVQWVFGSTTVLLPLNFTRSLCNLVSQPVKLSLAVCKTMEPGLQIQMSLIQAG